MEQEARALLISMGLHEMKVHVYTPDNKDSKENGYYKNIS